MSGTSSDIVLSDIYIMNNIFTDLALQRSDIILFGPEGSLADWGEIGSGSVMIFDDNFYELSASPSLDADHRPDDASDPVVAAGFDLSSLFTTDKDGVSRPQGSAWDIGAYEFG